LLNASVGVQRVLGRLRRPQIDPTMTSLPAPRRVAIRGISMSGVRRSPVARRFAHPVRRSPAVVVPGVADIRRILRAIPVRRIARELGHERLVAVAVAVIVLGASFLSVTPIRSSGATGGTSGDGQSPRLAIGASGDGTDVGSVQEDYLDSSAYVGADPDVSAVRRAYGIDVTEPAGSPTDALLAAQGAAVVVGPFLADGTLLKPVAVDTAVPDGRDLMRTYKVRSGDTLATIARKFNVSMMTLWWANKLESKDRLVIGQQLRIPPVNGLVIEVTAADTLDAIAARYEVTADDILATNGLTDRNLVVGQVLMLPGARGARIAEPRARPQPRVSRSTRVSGGGAVSQPRTYTGGRLAWPTTSHHISQYYHYGHYAIDIDGNTGDPIWAAASGTVIFAGWKDNGGGYQVWISHGSNLYTTYNHMSSVSVGRGQTVGRGQRVGRMGATGNATGSHLHFEVWRGRVWDGGTRVNPLAYL
jgi:murein DD-endopeptidase MepM/ murein hydrolase activator NlpD